MGHTRDEGEGEAAIGVSHISAFDTLILFVLFLSQLKLPNFKKGGFSRPLVHMFVLT